MSSVRSAIHELLQKQSSPGIALAVAAAIALVISNSPLARFYEGAFATPVAVQIGAFALAKPLLLWINEGLMALFFLVVGLEIKREIVGGALSSREQALLPLVAAIGGMTAPALIYLSFNWNEPVARAGWAIPTATDIAFALGVFALLGSRAPVSLKIFLTAVAVIDDLGAIMIIGLFYTADLSAGMLIAAAIATAILFVLNRAGVVRTAAYILVGALLWLAVVKSGFHATLAGVVTALAIPLRTNNAANSPLITLQDSLHPWVAFGILPLFAFANAGVSLAGVSLATLAGPVPLGIALGLAAGKFIGVFGASFALIKSGVARMPEGATWMQFAGVTILCGIGFTMSLFIGSLAFEHQPGAYDAPVRLGVLSGSIVSALVGWLVIACAARPDRPV